MTLTIENVPDEVDRALRQKAAAENKSLDDAAIDALALGLGVTNCSRVANRDLSFLAAGPPLEPEVLRALDEQRRIDPELWQ
jgi:plasmid stability protein